MSEIDARLSGRTEHRSWMPRSMRPDPVELDIVTTTARANAAGITDTMIATRLRSGAWTSLYRGHYRRTSSLDPDSDPHVALLDTHVARAVAAARANPSSVIALESAAAMLGLPLTRPLPELPQLIRLNGHGKIRARAHVHQQRLDSTDYLCSATHPECLVTTGLRTFADVARMGRLADAFSMGDRALRLGLFTIDEVRAHALTARGRGVRTLRLAASHLDGARETPLESLSFAAFVSSNLPLPEVQVEFDTRVGTARVDFHWRSQRVVGEADGAHKYSERADLVVEKRREDALRELGLTVIRWTWSDVADNFTETMSRIARALDVPLALDSPSPLLARSMSTRKYW